MKEIMVAVALMVATATPVFAQAYCACWGTGNVRGEAIAEQVNRAYGYAMSVTPQGDAAASAHASRHMKRNQRQ